jgi:hypothetical protein
MTLPVEDEGIKLVCTHTIDPTDQPVYYYCRKCSKFQPRETVQPFAGRCGGKYRKSIYVGLAVTFGVVIPIALGLILHLNFQPNPFSTWLFFVYFMAFTIGVILTAPIAFSFQRWGFEVVGKNNAKDIIQINATVIVGALFFLNLSPQAKPGFDIDTGILYYITENKRIQLLTSKFSIRGNLLITLKKKQTL